MNRRIVEVNDVAQLARYASAWDDLHARTPDATFFQTWEWLAVSWKHFPRRQKLRLIVVLEEDVPVGFVPFCVREQTYRVGNLRVLSYPLEDWGPFFGPVGVDHVACFRLAIEHVLQSGCDWDLIDLRYLREQCESFDEFRSVLSNRRQVFYDRPRMVAPVVELHGDWDAYVAAKSKNWRRTMRRERSQIDKLGEVRLESYRTDPAAGQIDTRPDLWSDCLQAAQRSWQATSSLGAAFCSPAVLPVLEELHQVACRRGMIDMNVLYLNDSPVAFLHSYYCRGEVYALRSGYDASCPATGLGTVLLYEVVRRSFEQGDHRINLGPGTQDYKMRFATDAWRAINFTHYSTWSLRSQTLRLRTAVDSYLPGFDARCQKQLVT
ncbi:GNAT family N-acetyltransferase [Blastopirellula marina]|uniref:BioF2-like acetyltransferase domain-containing protein n=1 Tax=Blastopirellula marina TaxID=124 RepID=A0A2S8F2Q7_9BACT|nr:GNAT family N-acetyltransferase [Blastopirellula marina]PQO26455.1 hypothetical protein C5Y98_30420 [Blastopirellula marina]PTL40768.1 GNAT family N-acetyltransferase [Blastopirellula marina]